MSLINDEILNKVVEILDKQSLNDIQVRNTWTGDAHSIKSANVKKIRMMRVSGDFRLRSMTTKKMASNKPYSAKSEPKSIDLWAYYPEWLRVDGWSGSSEWKEADEFWEECPICKGEGRATCSVCGGHGSI